MNIIDLNNAPNSDRDGEYGGASGLKEGIIYNNEYWLVKYPKNAEYLKRHAEMDYTNDPLSEYLGSHIYQILGYPVHETILGKRRGKIVVACKDFRADNERLLEFRTIKNSANNELSELLDREFSSTSSSRVIDFDEILLHLDNNNIINKIPGLKKRFFDMIVIDAFINNSDRNNGNWGIIRSKGKEDRLAPIYDNGGAFNGKTPDSRLKKMIESNNINAIALNGISVYGKESINYQTKNLLLFDNTDLQLSICDIYHKIDDNLQNIEDFIASVPEEVCSKERNYFYRYSISLRFEILLTPAYKNAINRLKEKNISIPISISDKTLKQIYETRPDSSYYPFEDIKKYIDYDAIKKDPDNIEFILDEAIDKMNDYTL